MSAPVPRPRATVEGLLATAAERKRQARMALRRHRDVSLIAGREANAEDERLVRIVEAARAEIDALLDELATP